MLLPVENLSYTVNSKKEMMGRTKSVLEKMGVSRVRDKRNDGTRNRQANIG